MKESTLWKHIKDPLARHGKFQKISDRFTPGVPDVLGCSDGRGIAMELKELDGVRILKTKFRPGQLDFLRDWENEGGWAAILSTHKNTVFCHAWDMGKRLEAGISPEELKETALFTFAKTRTTTWRSCVEEIVNCFR